MVDLALGLLSGFAKADPEQVCFVRTGLGAASLNQDIRVSVGSLLRKFTSGSVVVMPALTAGTDYAVYVCADGSVLADANFSAPTGYTAANSRKIGGFYYGPGSMASAQAGGDTTPQILAHSFWDLKWRPRCPDPRGMGFVSASVGWVDLWPLGVNWITDGTSRMGAIIADGASPPKKPLDRGGNGATAYSSLTQYEATEIFHAVGKTLLSYAEFQAAAYGTTEEISRGNDPVTTGFATTNAGSSNADQKFTSAYMYMASGVQWWWSRDLLYRADGADAVSITAYSWKGTGRGSAYTQGSNGIVAGILGGLWDTGSSCGSRASSWHISPWYSHSNFGARGRCDHLFHV